MVFGEEYGAASLTSIISIESAPGLIQQKLSINHQPEPSACKVLAGFWHLTVDSASLYSRSLINHSRQQLASNHQADGYKAEAFERNDPVLLLRGAFS